MGPLSPHSLPLLVAAGMLLAAVGMGLALLGRRGRRIDDHPVCRQCGYDLVGRPESSSRCAECGADLTRPRAVGIGNRVRRVAMGRLGALVLLIGLSGAGWSGYRYAKTIEWIQYEPLSWLVEGVDTGSATRQAQAKAEIIRRLQADAIGKRGLAWLIDHALDHVGAAQERIPSPWEPVLDQAFTRSLADDRQVDRYIAYLTPKVIAAVQRGALGLPAELVPGRPFPIRVNRPYTLSMTVNSLLPFSATYRVEQVRLDGVPATFLLGAAVAPRGVVQEVVQPDWEKLADRQDNLHDLSVHLNVTLDVSGARAGRKLTLDVEVKKQVHIVGGVAGDRTI